MDLDKNQGDLYSKIQELEFYFVSIIQMEICQLQQVLFDVNNFMIQLDAYISILMAVIEFKLVPPVLHNEYSKPVKVVKARNLLVEYQRQSNYVKQDFNIPK